jgi:hypothetical protein
MLAGIHGDPWWLRAPENGLAIRGLPEAAAPVTGRRPKPISFPNGRTHAQIHRAILLKTAAGSTLSIEASRMPDAT